MSLSSGREAINNLMRHKPVDHVPLHDSPWSDALKKWATQGMPVDEKGEPVEPIEHFGFEIGGWGIGFNWQANIGAEEVLEETADWQIVRNGSGGSLKKWKSQNGVPEHIDFRMTSREIWDRDYRPLLANFDRRRIGDPKQAFGEVAKWHAKGRWVWYADCFIWEFMRESMGDYAMFMALVDDPAWIHDFARVYTDLMKQGYKIMFEEGGLPDGILIFEDLGYKNRLFCSPEILETLIFPYLKELVDFLHGYNLPVVLHSCGFQEPALPLIVQAGFDGLNPMEVKAGNDIFKFAERYGDKLVFVGGLDARILESGDRAAIRQGVVDFITGMKARGARFVYGSDHSVSPNISYSDFLYSLDVYREHMMY